MAIHRKRAAALGILILIMARALMRAQRRSSPSAVAETDDGGLDVLIIGAGMSGIGAARYLQQRLPDKRFALLEAREAIGGTWDLFRYPGIRSDSDVYTFSYSFKPWTGRKSMADGAEIRQYIQEAAEEADLTRHIHFGHRVQRAAWDSEQQQWTVIAETPESGSVQTVNFTARFLYLCTGYYRYDQGYRPDFPGEETFRGTIVHPQFWPEDLDYGQQRVVVIGSGATAVTLVPALAESAAHVTMVQRSPSYVAVQPLVDEWAQSLHRHLPSALAHGVIRWRNIVRSIFQYTVARQAPALFKAQLKQEARRHLGDAYDPQHFTPNYEPWDQRVCAVPDGDLFQCIREGKATVVTGQIETFTPDGIRLTTGVELPADLIVTATGLQMNVLGDIRITLDGQTLDPAQAMIYKGMMLSGVPNAAYAFGYLNAAWTLKAELTHGYVCRLLEYMDAQGYGMVTPRADPSVPERPLLAFNSGYINRMAAYLPKQGDRRPWQVYQNYLRDKWTIQQSPLNDGVLRFSRARHRLTAQSSATEG